MNPETSPSPQPTPSRSPLIAGIIAVAILVLVIGGISLASKGDEPADTAETSSQTADSSADSSEENTDSEPPEDATYTNGTYSGSGNYTSPGGTEEVEVSVTLEDGKITDATVTTDPASATSEQYQGEFQSGYKDLVIGKNIDDVKLTKVSGSSLTSQGFNEALEQIKQDAKQQA